MKHLILACLLLISIGAFAQSKTKKTERQGDHSSPTIELPRDWREMSCNINKPQSMYGCYDSVANIIHVYFTAPVNVEFKVTATATKKQ